MLYRHSPGAEVLIAHMGGPFWASKDEAAWSVPKGLLGDGEDALAAARREFGEELGIPAPDLDYRLLGEFRQRSGKVVIVFTAESELEVGTITSNTFDLEWPPRSGRIQQFPEMDAAGWFPLETARGKLVAGQRPALDALEAALAS